VGRVWFELGKSLPPIVWQVKFPTDIQEELDHKITHKERYQIWIWKCWGYSYSGWSWEKFVDLAHAHVSIWHNNMPTVAWALQLLVTKAIKAAQILRMLPLQMMDCKASPLTTLHVPGTLNTMADVALCLFKLYPRDQDLLTKFNKCFALPQNACWNLCLLLSATSHWACKCIAINNDVRFGVVALTHRMCNHYWRHRCKFIPVSVNLYLCGWCIKTHFHTSFCSMSLQRSLWMRTPSASQ